MSVQNRRSEGNIQCAKQDIRELKIRRRRASATVDLVEGVRGRGRRCNGGKISLRYARDGVLLKRFLRSLERAMATFRKVRELLLLSYDDGDILEDEFLLLYDANNSKNPDFPYQITSILTWKNSTKVSVGQNFVFEKGTYLFSQRQ